MAANLELLRVKERDGLRGFSNLYRKETRAWWGTRRWWINALLWTGLLCGLTAIMLFVPGEELSEATEAEIAQAGGETAFIVLLGLNVFFQFGVPVLAIGTIILAQDLIIGERQSGVAEWLLSKPVTRRAYILAKLVANALAVSILLIGLPAAVAYGLLALRLGTPFPLVPFVSAVGIMAVHTVFYLTLTLMLGTIFNNRGPILGIAVGSVLAGGLLGSIMKPLYYVTPWTLPKAALFTVTGQASLAEMEIASLVATALWSVVFIIVAFVMFEKMEY